MFGHNGRNHSPVGAGTRLMTLTAKEAKIRVRQADRPCPRHPGRGSEARGPVIVVMAVEEFERLKALDSPDPPPVAK
jgi:hypothetical protein